MRRVRKVICFPPITGLTHREGSSNVELGWTMCRGYWEVSEDEAIAFMERRARPSDRPEARRLVYRCPRTRVFITISGNLETRRCQVCCRRNRISHHTTCRFDCEPRFDSMAPRQPRRVESSLDLYIRRYQRSLVTGLLRAGVSCNRIASAGILSMARELIQIGVDAQAVTPEHHAKISAGDIACPLSRPAVEQLTREIALEEHKEVMKVYQSVGLVNMKVDAGSVLRSHVTHCLVDSPLKPFTVPIVMNAAENKNWDTSDYQAFFLMNTQEIESQGMCICTIVHDNLPAQSNALARVLDASDRRPRTLDIPCFNHMINLVLIHAMRQNKDLREMVKVVLKWQRLMRALKIQAPSVPRTRWMYIVEVIEVIITTPNLEDAMSANPRVVYDVLQAHENEVPAWFVELHAVLLPLMVLSKKMEERETRLPHIVPLVSDCIQEWQKKRSDMKDHVFLGILDSLVTNLIASLRTNAFDEVIAAFVLSVDGKRCIESRVAGQVSIPHFAPSEQATHETAVTVGVCVNPVSEGETVAEELQDRSFVEDVADDEELYLDDPREHDTEPETATQKRRAMLDEQLQNLSTLSLDDKLGYDILDNFIYYTCRCLVAHGITVPQEKGGDKYYEVALTQWMTYNLQETLTALEHVQHGDDKCLDFLVWEHHLQLSRGHNDWAFWGPIAQIARYLVVSAVSEAAVERLFSIQKIIQGSSTTNISTDGITARLRLYGNRSITDVDCRANK